MRRVLLATFFVLGVLAIGRPATVLPDPLMQPFSVASPHATVGYQYGFRPVDLQRAYNVPTGSGTPTVAVVVAYDNPNAEADLGVYRSQFGLPACTTANGCFRKVNQTGGTTYPSPDTGWAGEAMLDVSMVSAICPNCKILLVEANNNSFSNLLTAIDYAATQTPFISNSWGANEFSGEESFESRLNKPGVVLTFSTGDDGFGVSYPAASKYVVAVGGTSLYVDGNGNRTSETAWSGAGYGCSAYIAKPAWQTGTGCANRANSDVSAVGDPNTGVAVYSSYGGGGWYLMGGTSASAPIIASLYAVAGSPAADTPSAYPWANKTSLFDAGTAGYDGPTGLGSPNGVNAFKSGIVVPPSTTTTTAKPNKPPVVTNFTRSCSYNRCTFTVTASDPERKTLKYSWSGSTTTSRSAVFTFPTVGAKTATVYVTDGVNTTTASKSVNCVQSGTRIRCS